MKLRYKSNNKTKIINKNKDKGKNLKNNREKIKA